MSLEDEFVESGTTWPDTRDKYFTGASNNKGNSRQTRVWAPPEVFGQMDALIASKAIPVLQTRGHVFRDSWIWRLHDYSVILKDTNIVMSGELEILSKKLRVEAEAGRVRALADADKRLFDLAHSLLNDSDQPGAIEAAGRLLNEIDNPSLKNQLKLRLNQYG